ncbi:hypothetical protein [Sorangium sp. So ce426]|uniref:hypothetical protein n=1 Tax=Sorangium sp. So ce426 TaxID=3133312 RepID=UPI003F5AF075
MLKIIRTAAVYGALALAAGCAGGDDDGTMDEPLGSAQQSIASSTHQFAGDYLKNVPTTDGRTQWSSVVINNPNPTPATVTLTIHRNDGTGTLAVLSKTIPARGWYNSYGQPDWLGATETDPVNHRSTGWIELTSDVPVVANNRLDVRTGTTFNSPVALFNDAPFLNSPSLRLFSPYFLRNWPTGMSGVTQWTDVTVNNPNAAPAHVTVRVHKIDGSGVHATRNVTVPAKGSWSSYGKPEWLNIPPTDPGNGGAIGWIEVLSDAPVVASSRLAKRSGATYDASPLLLDDSGFQAGAAHTLRAPLFLKGSTAGGTSTQWSHPVVVNPNPTPTTINVVVRRPDGTLPDLASFSRTIPAMGWWNAFGDASWSSAAGLIGWTEITASQPVFGLNRVMFRDGNTASSPFKLFDDEPLVQTTGSQSFATFYLKKWPSTAGYTQWTDLVVNNPSSSPATITVRIHKVDGSGDLTFFTRQIAGRGMWRSGADPEWLSLPASDPANGRSVGWVEITSSSPVIGLNRVNLRSGDTPSSPVVLFEDTVLQGDIGAACDPIGPGVFCARTTEETVSRFKELMIVNPSVVNDPVRASSAQNGHWSFRWLMEQMVTPGADPSEFVASWLSKGFAAGTVNEYPVQDRVNVMALIDSWPKIPGTNKIDLSQSPFKLLAIVNRIDLASGGGAGEGRFVFGLNQGGSAQAMTVIFEYKLPASASREVWTQRFHALGTLPFGENYNARLQMITDQYAARGANLAGVNGSALGQLRTNELLDPLFSPWQLREFNLVADSPARLRITTTKQTPAKSFAFERSAELASYVSRNASAILAGTAIVPGWMLGGESDADFEWTVPGVSEQVRHAFAQQTCNGCHAAEAPVIDNFYHVSPLRTGGSDGTGRLSPFLLTTDLQLREDFLQATLCAGNCRGVGPARATSSRAH